jgi:DNA-binding NarL/FixJ family response regulator
MEHQGLIDVLVVDGHFIVAKGLAMVVDGEPSMRVVGTAGSIKEAVELSGVYQPNVVLMDVDLPDGDAIAAIRRIRAVSPGSKIVVVTGASDNKALAIAVDMGCIGYVHKAARVEELLGAVSAAAADRAYFPTGELARLLRERWSTPRGSHTVSEREREVLQLLADGRSVAEIAGCMELSTHTVRNHIRRAMKHLGVHTRLDAVVAAARAGILTVESGKVKRVATR